jgi:hypothetical protein
MPGLRSETSDIITLAAPTGGHENTSYPQSVHIGSDGTSHEEGRSTPAQIERFYGQLATPRQEAADSMAFRAELAD